MNREHLYEQAFASTAVQLRFVTREQLAAVIGPSLASGPAAVSELLCERGLISEDEAAAIAAIVRQQLAQSADGTAVTDPAATQADRPAAPSSPAAPSPFATDAYAGADVREDWSRFTVLRPHAQGGLGPGASRARSPDQSRNRAEGDPSPARRQRDQPPTVRA